MPSYCHCGEVFQNYASLKGWGLGFRVGIGGAYVGSQVCQILFLFVF